MASSCDNRVETLHLDGEDAVRFIDAFLRPSPQQIERMNRIRERINNSISTVDTDYGFQAIVSDLDLSFLEGDGTREYRVEAQMTFDMESAFYESTGSDSARIGTHVKVKRNMDSNSTAVDESLKNAA